MILESSTLNSNLYNPENLDSSTSKEYEIFDSIENCTSVNRPPIKTFEKSQATSPKNERRCESLPIATSKKNASQDRLLYAEILKSFLKARNEFFEDGEESLFAEEIEFYIRSYKVQAMEIITSIIINERASEVVVAEALKLIGQIQDNDTYKYRFWLLSRELEKADSIIIRHGALIGISELNDPGAVELLEKYLSNKSHDEITETASLVLRQIKGDA